MSNNYSYNYIIINYLNSISSIENILIGADIEYTTFYSDISTITAENILEPIFPAKLYTHYNLWINLYQEQNNDYWIILEDNVNYIDFDKLNDTISWICSNYEIFDIINLSCNFLCNSYGENITINDELYLKKNLFNLSLNGYIITKTFIKNFINIITKDSNNINYAPNILINLNSYMTLKYYNLNKNLIKYDDSIYSINNIYNNYKSYFFYNSDNTKIFYSICFVLFLLLNFYTKKDPIIYFLCIYILIYINTF